MTTYLIVPPEGKHVTEIGGVRFVKDKAETDLTQVPLSFAASPEAAAAKFKAMGFKVTKVGGGKETSPSDASEGGVG